MTTPDPSGYPPPEDTPPSYPQYGTGPYPSGGGYGGYDGPPMQPSNGSGTAALVLGILSLVIGGLILGIPAIILGRKGMAKAASGLATNGGVAKAGFVLGIIGTVLSVVSIIYLSVR